MKKPILFDCDGVFGDFVGGCLAIANEKLGTDITNESVKTDTRQYSWWNKAGLEEIVMSPGFCSTIPVIPGGPEFIEEIRRLDIEIMFVTSPMKGSKHWYHERAEWLEKHLGVKRTELTFATKKCYVNGLTFLDDHVGNILSWQEYQNRPAILVKQPWNEDILPDTTPMTEIHKDALFHTKKNQMILRTNDWPVILDYVHMLLEVEDSV